MSKSIEEVDGPDRQFVTALARGLDLLRCFDRPGVTLTVSELARLVRLSQATTWRLAHTLIERGYLTRELNGAALRIGVPALTLGYAAIEGVDFPSLALPYMRQITERTGATATLSFRQGTDMISVRRCDGDFVRPNEPVGWRAPLTAVTSGLAVLAALPDAARAHAMTELRAQEPQRWEARAARAERAFADYAQDGYVQQHAMMKGLYAAVAVALMWDRGGQAWALTCGGLASQWTEAKLHAAGRELLRVKALLEPALACASAAAS